MGAEAEHSFVERVCLPFFRNAQNVDGGWGFRRGADSRVESTSWALLALTSARAASYADVIERALRFVRGAQLADGSWAAAPKEGTGCWVTSLACLALLAAQADARDALAGGLRWLCDDWPQDSTPWRRLLSRFSSSHEDSPINLSYRGWSWTPGTSSWVEPTSYALLALEQAPKELRPAAAGRRRELAEAMLFDRMCPGGGWNCGNPQVYGVAGEPLVTPTCTALMALRGHADRPEVVASLQWLEGSVSRIQSMASMAWAKVCLRAYNRNWPQGAGSLETLERGNEFGESLPALAWTSLALSAQAWLGSSRGEVA